LDRGRWERKPTAKWGLVSTSGCDTVERVVEFSDVTLSPVAQRYCAQFGVDEDDLRDARAAAWSLYEHDGWLACRGKLAATGQEAIMF
jgi:hypothetical protein